MLYTRLLQLLMFERANTENRFRLASFVAGGQPKRTSSDAESFLPNSARASKIIRRTHRFFFTLRIVGQGLRKCFPLQPERAITSSIHRFGRLDKKLLFFNHEAISLRTSRALTRLQNYFVRKTFLKAFFQQ